MSPLSALPVDDPKEQIRNRISIVTLVERYVKLKPAGRNFKGLCPFHKEKTPSFIVTPDRGTFHCFGCQKGGDIFTFVQEIDGVDFREALVTLAGEAGVELHSTLRTEEPEQSGPKPPPKSDMIRFHGLAAQYYYSQIKGNEPVVAYFKKRQLKAETVREFMLGYAPSGWNGLVDHLSAAGIDPVQLTTCGLAIQKAEGTRPYDRFRDRIIFPLFDIAGKVVAFAGRAMTDDVQPKYLNSPETPIYRKSRMLYGLHKALPHIKAHNDVIVVEGYMDFLALYECGVCNVVATSGTAMTDEHAQLLRRYSPRVTLVFDGDSAGVQAAQRGVYTLAPVGLQVRVLILPEELDPDEFIRERGAEAFLAMVASSAGDGYQFLLDRFISQHGTDSPQAKSAVVGELTPLLDSVTDSIVQADYVRRLAERLSIPEHHVTERLKNRPKTTRSASNATVRPGPAAAYGSTLEGHFIKLLLTHPEKIAEASDYIFPETLTDRFSNELYSIVQRVYRRDPALSGLLDEAAGEEQKRAIAELNASTLEIHDTGEELAHLVIELQKKFIKRRLKEITRQMRLTPGDRELLKQQQDMASKLRDLTAGQ